MKRNPKLRSVLALSLVVFLVSPGAAFARWSSQADELPGIKSGGEVAKQMAIIGGIAGGALLTYFLLKKRSNKDAAVSEKAELSWTMVPAHRAQGPRVALAAPVPVPTAEQLVDAIAAEAATADGGSNWEVRLEPENLKLRFNSPNLTVR